MVEERTHSFGGRLREARERRGVSLRQIANTTKISVAVLEALERNDISRLPGGIFSRAFVRAYAVEVGLDPESTIHEFIAQFANESITAGHPGSERRDDYEQLARYPQTASAFLKLGALSVPVAAVVLYFALGGRVGSRPADTSSAAQPASTPALASASTDPAEQPLFVANVSATAPCFVYAVVDGRSAIDREMQSGDHEQLTVRKELMLTTQDGGALTVSIDGDPAKPVGRSGEPTTVELNAENFRELSGPQ